ncbi:hypothetical protein C8R47DRAFT_1221888 [Mycena vitilis]|nr:hypothetical protein C8R47DRAFT_1221888 [Mycena vitilis]
MRVDDDNNEGLSWYGIGGHCRESIPVNALDYIDNVDYLKLTHQDDFDDVGRYLALEPATQPDWRRPEEHYRGWMPLAPEEGMPTEWWQSLETATPVQQSSAGLWQIQEDHLQKMVGDLVSFRDGVEALCEHPKYDTYIACPDLFDIDCLHKSYETMREVQITAAHGKRSMLEMFGHMGSWIATVADWAEGLPEPIVAKILSWNLLSRPKRGFLISMSRDWQDIDLGHLIQNKVPLYYVWGLFEAYDTRFRRLDPTVMGMYRDACERAGVLSLWGDEVAGMERSFKECARFDVFLQWRRDPTSTKNLSAPVLGQDLGPISYQVRDFDTWGRRSLAEDEKWQDLDKLYHHVVVESRFEGATVVVFQRFHRKPRPLALLDGVDFMEEDVVETDLSEIRERFKGRCAPKVGQIFDPETGVERAKPVEESADVDDFYERAMMLPPFNGLGGRELRGTGPGGEIAPDMTRWGRALGPRTTGPSSDHSSERREGDSSRPMAFRGGWLRAMAQPDNAGNYRRARPSRRQNHPRIMERWDAVPPDPNASSLSRAGSARCSASPNNRRDERARTPPRVGLAHLEVIQERLARRADFMDGMQDWASQITHKAVLWHIPPDFGWNMSYLRDTYLVISEAAEVRLRLAALMTPGVRFLRHVLEIGIERGIPFTIALRTTVCQNYRPNRPIVHRATTKAQLETLDRRLELGGSAVQTHSRWLRLLGDIASLENARAIIGRGGAASWIVRVHGYMGLVSDYMAGPSMHVTVYLGGGNDSADDDSLGLRWDELSENDYACIYGYVAGAIRERDTWMYPPDELLEELSKHYYREWNPEVDDLYRRIKGEWDERPCRGKMRTRKEWRDFLHGSNHGKHAPAIEVDSSWIREGKMRLARAFEGSWNKRRIGEIAIPETFKEDF